VTHPGRHPPPSSTNRALRHSRGRRFDGVGAASSSFHFPAEHRGRIRTTNGVERMKRRTGVVRIFPNPQSCLRLATALLKEWHED